MDIIVIAGLALPAAAIYTAPALLAYARHLPATRRIIAIDMFLGWTLVGWAAALSMAARGTPAPGRAPGTGCRDPHGGHAAAAVPAMQGQPGGSSPHPPPCGRACGCPEAHVISVWHSLN
jgi:Superinfection immunity protein